MNRDTFKVMAHGQFVITHRGESLDPKIMQEYVEGALFAFDMLTKKSKETKQEEKLDIETIKQMDRP